MLLLKTWRLMKEAEEANRICSQYDWEYDTATSNDCGKFLDEEFFNAWDAYLEKFHKIMDKLYNNPKMRRIAEILDKDIQQMFRDWDAYDDDMGMLPFI